MALPKANRPQLDQNGMPMSDTAQSPDIGQASAQTLQDMAGTPTEQAINAALGADVLGQQMAAQAEINRRNQLEWDTKRLTDPTYGGDRSMDARENARLNAPVARTMSPQEQQQEQQFQKDLRERNMMASMTPQERAAYNKQQNDAAIARQNQVAAEMRYNARLRADEMAMAAANQQGPSAVLASGPEGPAPAPSASTPASAVAGAAMAGAPSATTPAAPSAATPAGPPKETEAQKKQRQFQAAKQSEFDAAIRTQIHRDRERYAGQAGRAAFKSTYDQLKRQGYSDVDARKQALEAAKFANENAKSIFDTNQDRNRMAPRDAAEKARRDAIANGATPAEAAKASRDAYANARAGIGLPGADTYAGTGGFGGGAGTGFTGQPLYAGAAYNAPSGPMGASAGAVRGANIVPTRDGPMMQGAGGALMPFVQDPVTGYALPSSNGMSQQEFSASLTDQTRSNLIEVLGDGTDPVAQSFQRMDADMRQVDADPRLSPAQKQMAKQRIQQAQDQMIWSAMGDPSSLMSGRRRMAAEQQQASERQQRETQVESERRLAAEQRRNAQLYERAYKQAEQQLSSDPFRAATPQEIHAQAMRLYMQSGGTVPGAAPGAPTTTAAPLAGAAGAPTAGARMAPQSGAPDSNISIDPQSPIDFQALPSGSLVAIMPDGTALRAMNFNGRAVAVPRNQAEIDMLPAGSLYVLEGKVRRGEQKEPNRKEGEVGGMSATSRETQQEQDLKIAELAKKIMEEKIKPVKDYQEQVADYKTLETDAKVRAAQILGTTLTPSGDPVLANVKPESKPIAEKKWTEGLASRNVEVLDAKGVWAREVQRQMVEVAKEKYAESTKRPPDWIMRRGSEIIGVDKPQPPSGFNASRLNDYANLSPGFDELAQAREQYYQSRGTSEAEVVAERMLAEAKKSVGAISIDKSGRQSVTVGGRTYPAVMVTAGGTSTRLPSAIMRQGKTAQDVGSEALALLTSGKTFAIDRSGRMVPFKFDPNDPRLKVMRENANKTVTAEVGAGLKNIGVKAAFDYVNDVFGYLPQASRKFILDNMLTNPQLGKQFGGYTLTG